MKSNELFEQIHSGQIKENSTIEVRTEEGKYIAKTKYKNGRLEWKPEEFDTKYLCDINMEFEVEEPEIDIQAIEELKEENFLEYNESELDWREQVQITHMNNILRAVKQLDRKVDRCGQN